jgi:Holliday junction DNA helicase RuvA
MYAYFKGLVESVLKDRIILETGNIGYEIYLPESEILKLEPGDNIVKVYTYLHVREDDMKLFGFLEKENLNFFKKLIGVSGVGPKVALGIISNITPDDMCIAIATDNILVLKSIPGIGPKMAQKIIFELKDKILKEDIDKLKDKSTKRSIQNNDLSEAITALQVLGYAKRDVEEIISNLSIENDTVESIIKKALKQMQKI